MLRLGGMALHNGLLLHSPRFWSAAIREEDGSISVASGEKRLPLGGERGNRLPLLRGVLRLADAFAVLPDVKRKLGGSVLPIEGPRMAAAIGASTLASAGLRRRGGDSIVRQELLMTLLALAPAAFALRNSSLASYHGAEHMSIGEFERASGEREGPAAKEHERCGSNLVGPLLATNLVGNILARRFTRRATPATSMVTSLVSLGAAMEAFRWMTKHPDAPISRAISSPGHALQRFLTTEEPTEAQLEVARAALEEILRLEDVSWPEETASASS